MLGRYASLRMLLRLLLSLVVVVPLFLRARQHAGVVPSVLAEIALVLALYTTILGPQLVRNDLRQDLANLPVLKTWPVTGVALFAESCSRRRFSSASPHGCCCSPAL